MKQSQETYTCDVTGKEIEDRFQMLELTLHQSVRFMEESESTVHLSGAAHEFEYVQLVDNDYTAYVGESGSVVMVEETSRAGTWYYGPDTDNNEVGALISTLDSSGVADNSS